MRKREKRHIVLIGLPGSGKSTLGEIAAKALDMPFADLDSAVELRAGMSVSEIFALMGEERFRALESEAAREAMGEREPSVVATGGGIVLREENVRAIRENGFVIFIDRPLERIAKDIACDGSRPLIKHADKLYEMERARRASYLGAADAVLFNGAGEDEAAAGLLGMLRKTGFRAARRPAVALAAL